MATPIYKVFVDWNADGDFADGNEDITGDVLSFNLNRGKTVKQHKAQASIFDCMLNNSTNKFNKYNTSGALYGDLKPARPIWVRMGYPVDDFTGTNGDNLTLRKPTTDDNFAAWAEDTSRFEIISNKLKANNDDYWEAVLNFGTPDCHVGVDFTFGGTGDNSKGGGLVLRWVDASNYLYIWTSTSTLYLSEKRSGTHANLESFAHSWSVGQTKYIEAECNGRQVSVWVDNVLILHENALNTVFDDATKFGVGGDPHLDDRWEDFGGWRSMFTGIIDQVVPRPEPGKKYAFMRAIDDIERLKRWECRTDQGTLPSTTKVIVDQILTHSGVVADADVGGAYLGQRIIDTGTTLVVNDSGNDFKSLTGSALQELYNVSEEEVGFYYIDGNGIHRFEAEDHRDNFPHTEDRAIWKDVRSSTPAETDIFFTNLEWEDGVALVENDIVYTYFKVSTGSATTIWRLGGDDNVSVSLGEDRPAIAAGGGTTDFFVDAKGDYISSIATPAQSTDFTIYDHPTGGSEITTDVTASMISGFGGNHSVIRLTNANASIGYVRFLRLRATKHTYGVVGGARAEDSTSAAAYGKRSTRIATTFCNTFERAKDRADKRLARRKDPYEIIKVTMPNGTKANMVELIHRSISDRVNVQAAALGLTASIDFYIENFKMSVSNGGMLVTAQWELTSVNSI